MVPTKLYYGDQHEWIRVEGAVGTVGVTDHAQQALGDITFVELPIEGTERTKGEEACEIESCKATVSVYAPVDGKILEGNTAVEKDPSLINSDPYGQGWIYKIQLASSQDLSGLMTADEYEAFLVEQDA